MPVAFILVCFVIFCFHKAWQADGFENSMELPELEADLNPTQEFLDIDRPSEDNFQQLSIQDCRTKLKTRKDVQAAETLAIEALATRLELSLGFMVYLQLFVCTL